MSLYIHIAVNNDIIKTFGAQNVAPSMSPSQYRICKYVPNPLTKSSERVYIDGVVYHHREEGAVVLAKKVLDFVILIGEGK